MLVTAVFPAVESDPVALAALTSAVSTLNAAVALKQDSGTAATDTELALAVALDRARLDAIEPRQIMATLGASYTLATAGFKSIELVGTLGPFASVPVSTVTLTGISAGLMVWLRVTQPSPGGCSLRVSDGVTPVVVPIAMAANEVTRILVSSPNGVDLDVVVLGGDADSSYVERLVSVESARQWAANPDSLIAGVITRDANGAATSAPVVWPDATTGIYTATTVSTAFPGAVDAYTITKGALTYTQAAMTRNTDGAVTTRPAITVA